MTFITILIYHGSTIICVCVCACVYLCMHLYMCVCLCACACVCMCVVACAHVYVCVHMHTCVCVCVCVCKSTLHTTYMWPNLQKGVIYMQCNFEARGITSFVSKLLGWNFQCHKSNDSRVVPPSFRVIGWTQAGTSFCKSSHMLFSYRLRVIVSMRTTWKFIWNIHGWCTVQHNFLVLPPLLFHL